MVLHRGLHSDDTVLAWLYKRDRFLVLVNFETDVQLFCLTGPPLSSGRGWQCWRSSWMWPKSVKESRWQYAQGTSGLHQKKEVT
jgi:hypothetical protein